MRHSSRLLNQIAVSVSVVLIGVGLLLPQILELLIIPILLLSVFIIGIPHGAIDHIMASELYGLRNSLKDHILFYASYLLIMLFIAFLWIYIPIAGMVLFLAISIYHFGQADMEDFLKSSTPNVTWYITRGTLIIGLIIFADTSTSYPIMAEAMRLDLTTFANVMPDPLYATGFIILVYTGLTLFGLSKNNFTNNFSFIADSIIITLLLLITGPLIGFAVYFALWHSIGHVNEMKKFFEAKNKSLTIIEFYKKAAPFTLISLLGLVLLFYINQLMQLEGEFVTLMFILISVLTLPHLFIADKMYREL
jgi:beta-carotene 15,15'-dioxygenase